MSSFTRARFAATAPIGWRRLPIGETLQEVSSPLQMRDEQEYRLVSVRRRFGGMFDRERRLGKAILTKDLSQVVPGSFVVAKRQVVHGATCLAPPDMEDAAVASSYSQFIGRAETHIEFFNWLARHSAMTNLFFDASQGVVIEKLFLRVDKWLDCSINLPPVAEQRKIAEVLDTVDEAIRKTEAIIAKLKQVKQGLLHDLLTRGIDENGELRDPDRHLEQFKGSPLGRIPKGWEVVELGEVASISSGSTPSRSIPGFWRGGTIPWVKTGEVSFNGICSTEEMVTTAGREAANLTIYPPGTMLVAMYGQGSTRGRTARLFMPATTNQACAAVEIDRTRLSEDYAFHYLCASYERFRSLGHGSNQTNLNAQLVGSLGTLLPPLDEQVAIATRLSGLDERAGSEGAQLAKLRLLKQGLMEDLLTGRVRVTPPLADETP